MKRLKGVHVWFLLSVAAAIALPPLLLRAMPTGYDACRQRVEAMPQAERERIERNFSDFLKMNEAERNHYRQMHLRLVEDGNAQGIYARLFENYTTWVQTVDPHQQLELRAAQDSEQRFALMRRILDEESEREMRPFMPPRFRDARGPGRRPIFEWLRGRTILDADRFQAMMEAVENSVDLSRAEREELKNLKGLERTFRLFEILEQKGTPLNGGALDATEINRIIEQGQLQPLVDSAPEQIKTAIPNVKLFVLTTVILANVRREYWIEVHEHRPTEEELQGVLNDLPEEVQENLLRLPPDEFDRSLRMQYAKKFAHLDLGVVSRAVLGRESDGEGPRFRPGGRFGFRREGGPADGRPPFPPQDDREPQPRSDSPDN